MFDSREFFELAERMAGDVDADRMAQIAATPEARAEWLRTAAQGGSDSALRTLARGGDAWAREWLAEHGDIGALPSSVRIDVASNFPADDPHRSDTTCNEIDIQQSSKSRL